jgi:hypothetical protein
VLSYSVCNFELQYCGQYQRPDVTLKKDLPKPTSYCLRSQPTVMFFPFSQHQINRANLYRQKNDWLHFWIYVQVVENWIGLYWLEFRPCHGFTTNLDHRLITLLCHCICCQNVCGARNLLPSHGAMSIQWDLHGLQFLYLWCRIISQVCVPVPPQRPCMHPRNH